MLKRLILAVAATAAMVAPVVTESRTFSIVGDVTEAVRAVRNVERSERRLEELEWTALEVETRAGDPSLSKTQFLKPRTSHASWQV